MCSVLPMAMGVLAGKTISTKFYRETITPAQGVIMLSVLIGVLIICVVGAICFWAIEKFVNDGRLSNLLKLLVVLICVGAILQRVLPFGGH